MSTRAVVDGPRPRAQAAQLLGIGGRARVAGRDDKRRRQRLVDRDARLAAGLTRRARNDVAEAAKRLTHAVSAEREQSTHDGIERVQAELESRRHTKVSARAAKSQRSSGFSSLLAWTTVPSGVTSSAPTRLSQVKPYCAVRCPIPPPSVRPQTPVEPTTPPGVTRPTACVAASKQSQVDPPSARAIRASPSTSTPRIR
jgi:hypothetical protein